MSRARRAARPAEFPGGAVAAALADGLREMQVELPDDACAHLVRYVELLNRWNAAFALSGVRDPLQMVATHVLDSLAVAPHVEGDRCLDVGTGAGVPGLVLAIVEPARHWTLLDASVKKATFCRQVVMELALGNAVAEHARVEELAVSRPFECITTRATFPPDRTAALVRGLLAPGGLLLCLQGQRPAAAAYPGYRAHEVVALAVPGTQHRHVLKLRLAG